MIKSKKQKIIDVIHSNKTVYRLFEEFGIDLDSSISSLVDVLLENDELIQEQTVLSLSENPERAGRKERLRIRVDEVGTSLGGKFFWLFWPGIDYYVWYNTGSSTNPFPPQQSTNPNVAIEVLINETDSAPIVASKTVAAIEATGSYTASISNNYSTVIASTEITAITFTDDSENANSNYSSKFFDIFNGTTKYSIWFDIEGTSAPPITDGILVRVVINASDSLPQVVGKAATMINSLPVFNASSNSINVVEIETVAAGNHNDAMSYDPIMSVTILSQGNETYTQAVSDITMTSNKEGAVQMSRNSISLSPDFEFTRIQRGTDDLIAALNQKVSVALELYPQKIASPHENNYRSFISDEKTRYIYFLKWIYYTYKYFNEEQFFFHNLVEHFIPSYDAGIISSTNNLKIYFDGLGIILDTLDQKIEDLYNLGNIDEVDEKFLQHIAQLLGYQREDFSIKNLSFREMIKNLVEIYQRKGSSYSFSLFFKLLGFEADLREYYWDRDAKNPEKFASITPYDYLYYLTIQDPRTRVEAQIEDMRETYPIQPVSTEDFVLPKDLRDFTELQQDYSIDEILGFRDSSLEPEKRFTYFKTNFINFKLTQFYTKQDLTAKDTDTILKYVRFLTPIYVSAFVEVVTTPWQDTFEMSNPLADEEILEGDPGTPNWIDILLPFLYVTLKEYIPLNLDPAPESAVVIVQHASTDDTGDGFANSALPYMFGNPDHGITVEGEIQMLAGATVDLSTNKYMNIKLDKGRGHKIEIQGNTIQTFAQLVTRINQRFATLGISATAMSWGISPNLDIRIRSNTQGPNSKIYLAGGLVDDIFTNLHTTTDPSVSGSTGVHGYQEFGLSIADMNDLTNLDPGKAYIFYVNVDNEDFLEIDVSGPTSSHTSLIDIINSINNHYVEKYNTDFIGSAQVEDISVLSLSSGRTAVLFRDSSTNNGKVVLLNRNGTFYRSGINFTLFDCDTIATANVEVPNTRFFISYRDLNTNQLRWTVINNEGDKEMTDQIIETGVDILCSKAIGLSNNRVMLVYSTSSAVFVRQFELVGPTEVLAPIQIYNGSFNSVDVCLKEDGGVVVSGTLGTGGLLIYLKEDGTWAINDQEADSIKIYSAGIRIAKVNLTNLNNGKIMVAYRGNTTTPPPEDHRIYFNIWGDGTLSSADAEFTSPIVAVDYSVQSFQVNLTENENVLFTYIDSANKNILQKVYNVLGQSIKKEIAIFQSDEASDLVTIMLHNGDSINCFRLPSRGRYLLMEYMGSVANSTFDSRLRLESIAAGETWDDTVENYAETSDQGHLFIMDGSEYIFDNYSSYYRSLGADFTDERNRFNTFYNTSPNDDLVDLVQDTLTFLFTLLVGTDDYPADNVDKFGFYPNRAGIFSRSINPKVSGNDFMAHFVKHLDLSDPVRNSNDRIIKELLWPLWKKDRFDNLLEETTITFVDDSENGNSNLDGKYFVIFNGHTKMILWYYKDFGTPMPDEDGLLLRIKIEPTDSADVVAVKTRNRINSHLSNSFVVTRNTNTIFVVAQLPGDHQNAYTNSPGLIQIIEIKNGSIASQYNDYSSWTMALDYFRPYIGHPPTLGLVKIKLGGSAYPAGVWRKFVYGVPRGTTGGAYLIEGDPTGTAIIEFTINDPDPAKIWPASAAISYVEETTGTWQSVLVSEITPDGKTIRATVDHFSVWGVVDSTTGELISDDFDSSIAVHDAAIVRIDEVLHGPQGLGELGGTAQYGPYEDFEAPIPSGGIITHGTASFAFGFDFSFTMSGRIFLAGSIIAEVGSDFTYLGSGTTTTNISHIVKIDEILATADFGAIISGGEAIARFADYFFDGTGGVAVYSATEYSHTRNWSYDYQIFGFIQMSGSAPSSIEREYEIEMSGGIVSSIGHIFKAGLEYEMSQYSLTIVGEVEHTIVIEREMSEGAFTNISSINEIDLFSTIFYGQILLGGAAEVDREIEWIPEGGIFLSGNIEIDDYEILPITSFSLRPGENRETLNDNNIIEEISVIKNNFANTLNSGNFIGVLSNGNSFSSYVINPEEKRGWSYSFDSIFDKKFFSLIGTENILGEIEFIVFDEFGDPIGTENRQAMILDFCFVDDKKIIFVGEAGRIANYDIILDAITYYDGSGAGVMPFHDGTNVITNIDRVESIVGFNKSIFCDNYGNIFNFNHSNNEITFPNGVSTGANPSMPFVSINLFEYSNEDADDTKIFTISQAFPFSDVIMFGGTGFVFNYIESQGFTLPDGTGIGQQPYIEDENIYVKEIKTINGLKIYFLNMNGSLFNFSNNVYTMPDGTIKGTNDNGFEPFYEPNKFINNYEINTISIYKNQLLFFTNSSEIFSFIEGYGWSLPLPDIGGDNYHGISERLIENTPIKMSINMSYSYYNFFEQEWPDSLVLYAKENSSIGYIYKYTIVEPTYPYFGLLLLLGEVNSEFILERESYLNIFINITSSNIEIDLEATIEDPYFSVWGYHDIEFDKVDLEESTLEFGSIEISGTAETRIIVIHIAEGITIAQSSAPFEIGYVSTLDIETIEVSGSADDDFEKIAILDYGRIEISGENKEDDLELIFLVDGGLYASGTNDFDLVDLEESTLDFGSITIDGTSEIDFELEGQLEYGQVNISGILSQLFVETDDFVWLVFTTDGRAGTSISGESAIEFERNFIGGITVSGTNDFDQADLEESTLNFGLIAISGSGEIGELDLEESTLDFGLMTILGTNDFDQADLEESTLDFGKIEATGSSDSELEV